MEKIKERGKTYALHKASDKLNDYYGNAMLNVVQFDGHDIQCAYIDGYLQAKQDLEEKEVNLENSIVCKVGWYDGFLLDYTQEQQDELLEKIGANVGDKVRVILIKE